MDRALRKNPDDRYQTSREMAVDFFNAIGMTELIAKKSGAPLTFIDDAMDFSEVAKAMYGR